MKMYGIALCCLLKIVSANGMAVETKEEGIGAEQLDNGADVDNDTITLLLSKLALEQMQLKNRLYKVEKENCTYKNRVKKLRQSIAMKERDFAVTINNHEKRLKKLSKKYKKLSKLQA